MAPNDSRTRQLLTILAKENSKTGAYQRTPAQFRETALDTHKITPAHDFGPSPDLLPPNFQGSVDYLTMLKTQRASARTTRSRSLGRNGQAEIPPDQIEYRSVFKPRPEQQHVCGLATAHRHKVYNSEYALLDTLEVQMQNKQYDQRNRIREMSAAEQRTYLDGQVREKQAIEAQEQDAMARFEEMAQREADAAVEAEKRKMDAIRAKNVALKNERLDMLQTARQAKYQATVSKQQEEAKALSDLQAALEQEKVAAAARLEAAKQFTLMTKADNDARIRGRREAEDRQKMLDAELMQAGIRLAEKQEQDREDARTAFKAMIDSRARGAGQKKIDDDRERAEREARLMKQFDEEREQAERLREERDAAKKERQKQELLQARKEFLSLKDRRAAATRVETAALREEAEAIARAAREAEERKLADAKARAQNNQNFLMTQMQEKEALAVDDMVSMSERERQMNVRLLQQAAKLVGPHPMQLTSKW